MCLINVSAVTLTQLFAPGFGVSTAVAVLSPATTASGLSGFKTAKSYCIAGGHWSLSLDPAPIEAHLTFYTRWSCDGEPTEHLLFYIKNIYVVFLEINIICAEEPGCCIPAACCLDETKDSIANLLQITLSFIAHRGIWLRWLHQTNLNPSSFSNLFPWVSSMFSSWLPWRPTWGHGCYRMFSTSLRQATDDWGSHFTEGNYLRFSGSLLTVGKDCFSLKECQPELFITWMTCNGIKTPPKTHSVLSRWQAWRQCLSF